MKKIKLLSSAALVAAFCSLAACSGGSGEGRNIAGEGAATRSDSLSNLFGQTYAEDYWRMAEADSALFSGAKAKEDYRRGVEKGMEHAAQSEAYVHGLRAGIEVITYSRQRLEKDFNVKIDPKAMLEGLDYGLKSDSAVNVEEVQQMLNELQTRLNIEKAKRERVEAEAALSAYLAAHEAGQRVDNFYIKVLTRGEGEPLASGTVVNADITVLNAADRATLPVGMPRQFRVGGTINGIQTSTLLGDVRPGERVEVTTSALDFFGNRCARYDVDPAAVITVVISVGEAE